jgi:hypothetical protein
MRNFAIALGAFGVAALLASPLAAAERPAQHSTVLVKGKKPKSNSKFKTHKGIKRKAHPVTRH